MFCLFWIEFASTLFDCAQVMLFEHHSSLVPSPKGISIDIQKFTFQMKPGQLRKVQGTLTWRHYDSDSIILFGKESWSTHQLPRWDDPLLSMASSKFWSLNKIIQACLASKFFLPMYNLFLQLRRSSGDFKCFEFCWFLSELLVCFVHPLGWASNISITQK